MDVPDKIKFSKLNPPIYGVDDGEMKLYKYIVEGYVKNKYCYFLVKDKPDKNNSDKYMVLLSAIYNLNNKKEK